MSAKKLIFPIGLPIILAFVLYAFWNLRMESDETAKGYSSSVPSRPPSPQDGKGTAQVVPNSDVVVNTYGTWKIVYTVGEEGIDVGGGIAVHVSPYWGWSAPQNENRDYPGYTSVSTSRKEASLDVLFGYPHYLVIRTKDIPLAQGDTITVTYGDTSGGKHPQGKARCDKYAEVGEKFFVKVDGDGDGHFYPIAVQPRLNILADKAERLLATATSIVACGAMFNLTIAAVDSFGNWAQDYQGTINLLPSGEKLILPRQYRYKSSDRGSVKIGCRVEAAGIYYITVQDKKNGFSVRSNPILCMPGPDTTYLYWGDLHGHSGVCDGTGTPHDYYQYARDVSGLDISALTSHDAFGFIPLDEDEKTWTLIKKEADLFYQPGVFVTFAGYEWTNWTYGHQHVIFLKTEEAVVCSSRNPRNATPADLWKCLGGRSAITIPHHVGGGPIAYDWSFYNPAFQPVSEICSIHGNCEYYGAPRGIYRPVENHFVQDALSRGCKLGIVASGDSHNGHPGQRDISALTAGLMGVYAGELTRESVWKALKKRSVYATSGARMILGFHINAHSMGEIIYVENELETRDIAGTVIGTDVIREMTIVKNGSILHSIAGQGVEATIHYRDDTPVGAGDYYYLRIIQEDGEMAWSSPIWVEQASTGEKEPT